MGGQSVNTGSSMGKMLITMLAGFAGFERNMIAERTTAALAYKKAHGEVYNHTPFGFTSLANHAEKYVSDVRETTQLTRHARTQARQLLTDAECRERARILIDAFAKSI